jgi:AP-3 complex subunit mu
VIEILHRAVDIFGDYFGECNETSLKENFVVVYEVCQIQIKKNPNFPQIKTCLSNFKLLDEMLDNGFPLATESNILKELIKPPNLFRKVTQKVTGETK